MIVYFHLTVILSVVLSGIFLLRWRRGISVHFPMIFLMIPIINLGYLKVATAQNTNEALLANGIEYLDGCFLELIFLLYIMSFCKLKMPKSLTALLLTVDSAIFFFAINNARIPLLYTSAEMKTLDGVSYLVKEYGPIHTVYYVMIGLYLFANFSALVYSFTRRSVSKINSMRLLVIYLVIIVSFLAGKAFHPAFELLPAAYTFSQVIFLIVMDKINLYDISENALAAVTEKGELGFASFDLRLRYLGCTEPVLDSIPELGTMYIDKTLKPENENFAKILECIHKLRKGSDSVYFHLNRNGISYKITLSCHYSGRKLQGYLLRAEDNTAEIRRLEALELRERQKEMEARMLKLEKSEADAANRAKSSFLAEMSHEIRTPINAMIGMNQMILRTSKEKDTLGYAANIDAASKTLLSLVNSILDFSKIEDGKMEIIPAAYKTRSLIRSLVSSVSGRMADKGLYFELDIDENLPSVLFGDDMRVRQVIQNLLTNAVKYTEKGSVILSVKDGGRDEEGIFLDVSVKDTGIGIKQEDMKRLFESFERLDENRNRNIEGTGLGMSIVSKLLSMMGTELKVESEYGKGSEFSFRLRQGIEDSEPIGKFVLSDEDAESEIYQCRLYAPGAKVLVVDDNSMNLKVAKNLMSLFGIIPTLASSGPEAIDLIRTEKYMIVFLDHMMPGMDGIETLGHLKEEGLTEGMKIIALSANAIIGARESYLEAGFDDYLSKPIDIRSLEGSLEKYLPGEVIGEQEAEPPAPEETENVSFKDSLPEGFDYGTGMHYCMDDEDFYAEMLGDYSDEAEGKLNELSEFLEKGDTDNYRILVHALKSGSKTLGAMEISAEAEALEKAAAEGNEDYIKAHHGELCEKMKAAAEGLKKVLAVRTGAEK